MRRRVLLLWLLLGACFASKLKAQVNVTATAGTLSASYSSIAAAVTAINTGTHAGTIVVNVAAGHSETAPAGGIALTATGTLADPITIQKNGAGANPVITAYTGGTGTPSTAVQDGIFRLVGSDYVTINGIDLAENAANTTNPSTMEYGYALYKASDANGCQNNTILNCVITLNRVNNATGAGPSTDGSRGIDVVNATATAATTNLTVSHARGANSNNKFYSNTIQNCNIGIAIIGFANVTPFALADTGNDVGGNSAASGNTIRNFGGGGTLSPAAGVRTLAQYALNVSYNLINNNDGGGIDHNGTLRGIYIGVATSANVNVTFNTISVKGGANNARLAGIENEAGSTPASNTVNLSNNTIRDCRFTTATSGLFFGILSFANPTNVNISNCTLTNNSTAATSGFFYLIANSGQSPGTININDNAIDGVSFTSASSVEFVGLNNTIATPTTTLNMNRNSFRNFNYATQCTGFFTGLNNAGGALVQNILSNTFTNITINTTGSAYIIYNSNFMPDRAVRTVSLNRIVGGFTKLGSGGTLYGYRATSFSPSNTTEINNGNDFSNITVSGQTSVIVWASLDGRSSSPYGPLKTITNNTFTNIIGGLSTVTTVLAVGGTFANEPSIISGNTISNVSGGANTFVGEPGHLVGVQLVTGSHDVFDNTISGLSSTGFVTVQGIQLQSGVTQNIYKNKIYGLSGTHAESSVYGISVLSGATLNIYNNLIGDLRAPIASSTGDLVRGVSITSAAVNNLINLSYNTIHLNASSSGANFSTSGIFHTANAASTTAVLNLRNNIIINNSVPSGTGLTVAYRRSGTALGNYAASSNNNLFYAGTPDASHLIFYNSTNADQTLAAYKTRVSPRDAGSVSENTSFLSLSGANAGFLHLDPAVPTQAEGNARPIAGIVNDYDGNSRHASLPDIGADEGNFIPLDLLAPEISYTALTNTCNTGDLTLAGVNIIDVIGIPLAGATVPRIYYRKGSGPWFSRAGTLSSGTANNSNWSFTVVASDMGGISAGDVISYYVIAQDLAATPNVGSNPIGAVASNVNSVSTHPSSPRSYLVLSISLSGTYTVGVGGAYTTLSSAINAYNNSCLTGPVIFSLIDASYPSETFPITILTPVNSSPVNTLTIKPAAGTSVTLSGNNGIAIIKLNGADNVIIDGSNAGTNSRDLTIRNTNAVASPVVIWLASENASNGANNNTVKNCKLSGNSALTTSGVIVCSGSVAGEPAETSNNNNRFANNEVQRARNGISVVGFAGNDSGNVIENNSLGSAIEAEKLGARGILVAQQQGLIVRGNTISGLSMATNNTVSGIFAGGTFNGGEISHNLIKDIRNTYDNFGYGAGANGIELSTSTISANILVANNMISDIAAVGYPEGGEADDNGFGIVVSRGGGYKIYFNSVNMNTNQTIATSLSAAICITRFINAPGSVDIRNNIFSNTQTVGDERYAIYSAISATGVYSFIDHNDYFTGTSPYLGYAAGSRRANLTELRNALGSNLNSVSVNPLFTSPTDLHIVSNPALASKATPIAGISVDFDNNARKPTPDIGADEFLLCDPSTNISSVVINATPAGGQACAPGSVALDVVVTNNSPGPVTYAWSPGNGLSSTNSSSVTASAVGTNVYTVTATNALGCTGTASVTVTIHPSPTAGITGDLTICNGETTTLTASGGTSYNWSNGATTEAINVNPAANTTYIVTVTAASGCSATTSVSVVVNALPNASISGELSNCTGESTTLTASGGTSYNWSNGATTAAINVSASGTFTVTVTDINGCTASASAQVSINIGVAMSAALVQPTTCVSVDGAINLTVTSGVGPFTYNWSTPNGAGLVNGQEDQANLLVGSYFVTVTGTNGCSSTATFNLTGPGDCEQCPTIGGASGSPSELCAGGSSTLTADGLLGMGNTYGIRFVSFPTATADPYTGGTTLATVPNSGLTNSGTQASANVVFNTAGAQFIYAILSPMPVSLLCRPASQFSVTVNSNPSPGISGNLTICNGQSTTLTASGGTGYNWSTGATTAEITVSPTTNTTYIVTVTNASSCSAVTSVSVTANSTPAAAISGVTSICVGQSTVLTATGGDNYSWSTGATTAEITVSPTTNTTYTVTVSNANNCSATASSEVSVNPTPLVSITGNAPICVGQSRTLTATGGGNYLWSTGATTAAITVSPTANTTYTVTVTNASSCTASTSVTVVVNPLPTAAITGNTNICSGSSTTLTASGGVTYAWSTGAATAAITVSPATTTTYTVTVSSAAGCSSTASRIVTVTQTPAPTITAGGPTTFCYGGSVVLNTATVAGYTYQWSKGGLDIPGATGTSYTVTQAGQYRVRVTNGACTASSAPVTVTVVAPPVANIAGNTQINICEGNSHTFQAQTGPGYTYQWYLNNAAIPGATASSYTATLPGKYKVQVGNGGCSTTSSVKILHVEPYPVVTAYPQETVVTCAGNPAIVEATVSGGSLMQWFLNGNPIPGATSAFLATVYAGEYQLRVTSNLGCVAWSNIVEVEVVEVVLDPVQVSSYQICPGQPAVLSMTQYPGHFYQWYKNGVWIPGAMNPTLTVTTPGTYHVEVQSPDGCTGYSEAVVVTELPAPDVNLAVVEVGTACKQTSYNITATSNVAGFFTWYFDGKVIPTPPNNTIINAPAGKYEVVLRNGCGADSASTKISYVKAPGIQIISEDKPILCPGDSITMIAVPGTGTNYQWFKDFVAIPGATAATYVAYEEGFYWVTANIAGCPKTSGLFKVFMNELGEVTITAAGPTDIPEGSSVELKVTPIPFATYQWYLDGNALAGETGTSHIAVLEGDYSLIATRNGCGDKSNVITVTVQSSKPRGTVNTQPLSMRYYPVPASQFVMVQSNKVGLHKLEVLGLDGRAYQELPVDFRGEAARIDLDKLQPGMYIIRAHYGEEVSHQMLPVQR